MKPSVGRCISSTGRSTFPIPTTSRPLRLSRAPGDAIPSERLRVTMNEMTFPPVSAGEDPAVWNGGAFVRSGTSTRVLAYEVGESGWSDELTELHESATESGAHFIDVASRDHAINELKRAIGSKPASIMEVGCSAGHLLADMRRSLPNAKLTGGDYTLGTLLKLGEKMPGDRK